MQQNTVRKNRLSGIEKSQNKKNVCRDTNTGGYQKVFVKIQTPVGLYIYIAAQLRISVSSPKSLSKSPGATVYRDTNTRHIFILIPGS
jgi:hypothetical protein